MSLAVRYGKLRFREPMETQKGINGEYVTWGYEEQAGTEKVTFKGIMTYEATPYCAGYNTSSSICLIITEGGGKLVCKPVYATADASIDDEEWQPLHVGEIIAIPTNLEFSLLLNADSEAIWQAGGSMSQWKFTLRPWSEQVTSWQGNRPVVIDRNQLPMRRFNLVEDDTIVLTRGETTEELTIVAISPGEKQKSFTVKVRFPSGEEKTVKRTLDLWYHFEDKERVYLTPTNKLSETRISMEVRCIETINLAKKPR